MLLYLGLGNADERTGGHGRAAELRRYIPRLGLVA